jgi:hypothetical protein
MTYGELKNRIWSLLDIDAREEDTAGTLANFLKSSLAQTVNAAARKAAVYLKAIYKTEMLYFEKDDIGIRTILPEDAAVVKEIRREKRRYGSVSFEKVGDTLYFFGAKEGFYTVCYFAYPTPLSDSVQDGATLEMNDAVWDTVAYGVGAELCSKAYPGDIKRYMRLATEFDERMTSAFPNASAETVAQRTFVKRRGLR